MTTRSEHLKGEVGHTVHTDEAPKSRSEHLKALQKAQPPAKAITKLRPKSDEATPVQG